MDHWRKPEDQQRRMEEFFPDYEPTDDHDDEITVKEHEGGQLHLEKSTSSKVIGAFQIIVGIVGILVGAAAVLIQCFGP